MRFVIVLAVGLATFAYSNGWVQQMPHATADSHGVEVTSALDASTAGGAICPHESLCTLRAAIEAANDDEEPGVFTISFSAAAFPEDEPVAIEVSGEALPTISRDEVTIDASGRGVEVRGSFPGLSTTVNGLTVTGARFHLSGIWVHGFSGACLAVTGGDAAIGGSDTDAGNVFGGCKTGVAVSGAGASIRANLIGFTPAGAADLVEAGIVMAAGDADIGGPAGVAGAGNTIGFADTGIFVGSGSAAAFTGVRIEGNTLGQRPAGEPAAVGLGIVLAQPSNASLVLSNIVTNAGTGIVVRGDLGGVTVTRNRLSGNVFDDVVDMAIDLGGDGVRNVNDDSDSDGGANTLLNHPEFARATQTSLTGSACPGCRVEVYLAQHEPGGAKDYGRFPLAGGAVFADAGGHFVVNNPAAAAGEWLVALAIDADGNTSEFGPPVRVGAGAVLCGNTQLQAGWNHAAYFGTQPVALFNSFAPSDGAVTAIYRYVDGLGEWQRWFADTAAGRTLHSVQPGESYWFFSSAPVTLPGGFSISFPVSVELEAGSNEFVYLGASAHPLDALSSLGEGFTDLHRYNATTADWERFGDSSVPAWAQEFSTVEACSVYQLRVAGPATLLPLQP